MNSPPLATASAAPPDGGFEDAGARAARATVVANSGWIRPLQQEIARVIVGQTHLIDSLLIALLTNGHVLLEGRAGPGEDARAENPGKLHRGASSSACNSRPTCSRPTSSAR